MVKLSKGNRPSTNNLLNLFSLLNCIQFDKSSAFYACFTEENNTKTIIRLRRSDYIEYLTRRRLG